MPKLVWDKNGERYFETGVSKGVLYPQVNDGTYSKGVAWNGLSAVSESPSGAEATAIYADDIKYLNLVSAEEFGLTVEAYTYPDEFAVCDGSAEITQGVMIGQQVRKLFGLSYQTILGNDVDGNDYGYKLHLVYGCLAAPSERGYATVNDSPEAITFSWEVSTTPAAVSGFKPTACIIIDSTKADKNRLAALEEILYGKDPTSPDGLDGTDPRLPLPDEVMEIMTPVETVSFTVAAEEDSYLLGKYPIELQSDIVVSESSISGTLHYVTGYTGFSSEPTEQEGNYLALKVAPEPEDATVTVHLVGGTKGPVTLDADHIIVLKIANKDTQNIKVTTTKGDLSVTKFYSLSGLVLEPSL